MARTMVQLVLLASAIYLFALAFFYVFQRDFLYVAGGSYQPPDASGLPEAQEVTLQTPDGETLRAWHHPAEDGEKTILYLQGNAHTLTQRVQPFRAFIEGGAGLLAVSYRGFVGSTGRPTQDGLITDALTAFDWLTERGDRIVIYGQSLGSGVASQLAVRREAAGLILEVPFTAAVDVGKWRFPMFPVRLLMKDQWRSRDVIADVDEPLLIVGAGRDGIIPVEQSQALYALASEPKRYVRLPESGHNHVWDHGMDEAVEAFLAGLD